MSNDHKNDHHCCEQPTPFALLFCREHSDCDQQAEKKDNTPISERTTSSIIVARYRQLIQSWCFR